MEHIIPDWATQTAVNDCQTVEEFAQKYRKADKFTALGKEYVKTIIESHVEDVKLYGFTCISKHDNITGRFVSFIPKN